MANVFLSYSRQDQGVAELIATEIERKGASVFKDTALVAGDEMQHQIEDSIGSADVVVVLLSENVERSKWVQSELVNALEQKKRIIPVLLGDNAKNNYVWSLVADRQAIKIDDTGSPTEVATKVSDMILSTAGDPSLYGLKL